MRSAWLLVPLALFLGACGGETAPGRAGAGDGTAASDSDVSADDRYVLKLREPGGRDAIARAGGQILVELAPDVVAARIPPAALASLRADPAVESLDVDPRRHLVGEQIPYGVQMVQAAALGSEPVDAKIRVCVVDSGYHSAHADLPKDVTASPDVGSGDWNVDACGHGTHVAGTIAALANDSGVVGVAPGAVELHVVKVFGEGCAWTYSSILAKAVYECIEAGAKIINLSLGGPSPHWFEELTFEWAWLKGALPVAAAGNDGDTSMSYPASYASVISVAAVDEDAKIAGFSQRNEQVELAAPGVGVLSTTPSGYEAWSGTSMATPHVTGVAALVWSRKPSWTNQRLRDALRASAFDLWPEGRDEASGFGIVRAREALLAGTGGSGSGDGASCP